MNSLSQTSNLRGPAGIRPQAGDLVFAAVGLGETEWPVYASLRRESRGAEMGRDSCRFEDRRTASRLALLLAMPLLGAACGGVPEVTTPPLEPARWVDVSVSTVNSCALSNRGKVRCWGDPEGEWLAEFPVPEGVNLKTFSHLNDLMCGIRDTGALWCSRPDVAEVTPGGQDFEQVEVGLGFACARRSDNSTQCFGYPVDQSVLEPSKAEYMLIAAAQSDVVGLASDGTADVWGLHASNYAQPDQSFEFAAMARGTACGVALDTNLVECWPSLASDASWPSRPVSRLFYSNGWGQCAEIMGERTLSCWSRFATWPDRWAPEIAEQVPAGEKFQSISLNENHACGITDLGDLVCWGNAPASRLQPPALEDGQWQ